MAERILHRTEKEIIRVLFRQARPMSIHEISLTTGMSWITAKKYLLIMKKKKIIREYITKKSQTKHPFKKNTLFLLCEELLKALYLRNKKTSEELL